MAGSRRVTGVLPSGRPRPRPAATGRTTPRRPEVRRRRLPSPAPPPAPVVGREEPPRQRRAGLTGRAAILAVAVCAVVLSLAYPLREYVAQRSEIAQLRGQRAAVEQRVAALEAQHQRWLDPTYVRTQARERLHMVMPGETSYVVVPEPSPAAAGPAVVRHGDPSQAWYTKLWSTVTTPPPASH